LGSINQVCIGTPLGRQLSTMPTLRSFGHHKLQLQLPHLCGSEFWGNACSWEMNAQLQLATHYQASIM
jgi:hypothetical protein